MKHTPGPWKFKIETEDLGGDLECYYLTVEDEDTWLVERGHTEADNLEQARANAQLIAAAPELLDFAQQIFNGVETNMITIDSVADETLANVLSKGRKALAKAKGEA